jgi:hypothetical protein
MRGFVAVAATAIVSIAAGPAAFAGSVLNVDENWCIRDRPEPPKACGSIHANDDYPLGVFTVTKGRRAKHFRVCSTSPARRTRCVPRKTSKVLVRYHGIVLRTDTFRFNTVFPHRLPGTYELTWQSHGAQLGKPLRFSLG